MDWGLVLASQDIPATIQCFEGEAWGLAVDPQDRERAVKVLRLYQVENRRWNWRQPVPWSEETMHWGALVWCLGLALIYRITAWEFPALVRAADLDSAAVWRGEWWRIFTATYLHGDPGHLLANLTTGFILLGLAMSQYGAGPGMLAVYLAGASGNLLGLVLYQKPYHGLGASGMVMGALGLLSVQAVANWRRHPPAFKQVARAALAGFLLFVLLGLNPSADVVAHLGGFAAGISCGLVLNAAPGPAAKKRFEHSSWLIFVVLNLLAWRMVWLRW